jgi:hypothetical protein
VQRPKSGYLRYVEAVQARDGLNLKQAMIEAGLTWKTCSERNALQAAAKADLLAYHIAIGKKKPRDANAVRKGRFENRALPPGWERKVLNDTAYFTHEQFDLATRAFPCSVAAFEEKLTQPKKRKAADIAKPKTAATAAPLVKPKKAKVEEKKKAVASSDEEGESGSDGEDEEEEEEDEEEVDDEEEEEEEDTSDEEEEEEEDKKKTAKVDVKKQKTSKK